MIVKQQTFINDQNCQPKNEEKKKVPLFLNANIKDVIFKSILQYLINIKIFKDQDMDKDLESMSIPQLSQMKNKLDEYQKKEIRWNQQRQKMAKNMILMEQEIKKQKNINAVLLKKSQHKRTCSDEQTFIFNQTNISSYYPVMLLNQKQKQQAQKHKKQGEEIVKTSINKRDGNHSPSPNGHNLNSNSNIKNVVSVNQGNASNILQNSSNTNTYVNSTGTHQGTILNLNSGSWISRANLRSHLDSVRTLRWQGQFLISAGQDCLLKIWEKDKLRITVREHLAPIFCLCGDQNAVFSGGAEGVVRKWMVDTFLESGRPAAEVELHDDSIWDMIWISKYQLLVTSSSDNSMKMLKSNSPNSLTLHSQININPETPTSICSIQNELIGCGLVKSKKINLYNVERPSRPSSILTFQNSSSNESSCQPNKLLYLEKKNLLISGHEDHNLRLFDISSNKTIGSIVAHSDAVTSLCARENSKKQYEIISSSHDGTVRVWDVRKWKCIHDIGIHMKKYDESLLALAYGGDPDLLAVGGADGQIKLLSPQI